MATERSAIFLETNVLDEAKARMRHLLLHYDHVWVSFSGGKDSLCALWLLRETMDDLGMQNVRTKAFFRDEEIIPEDVIEFVQGYCTDPALTARFDIRYYAVPMTSHIFMMGEHIPYVQWDEGRDWIRQKPDYAITQIHPENKPLDQHHMNGLTFENLGVRGKIAVVNGIRADESLTRFRSSVIKKGRLNWVLGSPSGEKNIDFCRPIFDWSTEDLFKFFKERGITYPVIYDVQMYSGESLRVATPLHDRAYTSLVKLRETYPVFYDQILSIWPEVATQERYYKDVDTYGIIERYARSWEGIMSYIEENIEAPADRKTAIAAVSSVRKMREKNKRLGRYTKDACYGFPLLHVFRQVVSGKYMKGISSQPFPSPSDLEYEEAARFAAGGNI